MDADTIITALETDYIHHRTQISSHTLHHIIRLIDESARNKLDILAEAIVLLLRFTDTRKREVFVAALDGALKWAGHCHAFESVFRTTEYELYGPAFFGEEALFVEKEKNV
jgi:hypothetical protein